MSQGTFVGRQPIVDRERRVVAYELLFRSSAEANFADFDEVGRAAVRVMVNTFAALGMEAVLGHARGFFNVNHEVLLSESLEALPRDRVVLEVLEDVEPTDEVRARCRELHEAGFTIALDDWVVDDPRESLLPWASVVKVDLPAIPPKALRKLTRSLRERDVQLLAEKVETAEEFEACHKLGFDLFQGFFFARPIVLEGADMDAAKTILLKLLQQISSGAETAKIVETFKQDAKLGLNLLRLVNTAGRAARVRLDTIEAAVRHLGLQQLGRWCAILLYAQGPDADLRSPLLVTAAHRGRLMELVVGHASSHHDDGIVAERAFLVGMLSLADALLGRPIESLVSELRLSDVVGRALTHHDGDLGRLLSMAIAIEAGDVAKFEPELAERDLDFDSLQAIENAAYAWVHGLTAAD
ncbi:MAG: EAL domain-containing protein [bacterium]|nr:EAL domain-containing protein [bacterium]